VSLVAIGVALGSFAIAVVSMVFAFRSDGRAGRAEDRAERADERELRREQREEAAARARRQGRPIISRGGMQGGAGAERVKYELSVRNGGESTITELVLWIVDGTGETISTSAGGPTIALAPGDPPIFTSVDVIRPDRPGRTLLWQWKDADGEHTEPTGIELPRHA
jgi:hypothetical protein